MEKGSTVKFTDRYSGRTVEGTYRRTLSNGNLLVAVATRAARGGAWVATSRVVKPEQVIA